MVDQIVLGNKCRSFDITRSHHLIFEAKFTLIVLGVPQVDFANSKHNLENRI